MKLVLASQSPRRREILEWAGFEFEVRVAGVEEERGRDETAVDYVRRLAREKAQAVQREGDELVLGADTVVAVDGQILEKPRDAADARRMLRLLSGRSHSVFTGIALVWSEGSVSDHAETGVRFAPMTDREISEYVESGEPLDKAGAYAIQGLASKFVTGIDGCYFNVVGLPVSMFYDHYKRVARYPD